MKKQTYADRAKQIMNKYKARLGDNFDKGDTLALEAMNQELSLLRDEQESERAKMTLKEGNTGLPMHSGDTKDGSRLKPFSGVQVPYRQFYESSYPSLTNSMISNSFSKAFMFNNTLPKVEIMRPQPLKESSASTIKPISVRQSSPVVASSTPVHPTYKGSDLYMPGVPQNLGFVAEGTSKLPMPTFSNAPGLVKNKLAETNNVLATNPTAGNTPFKSRVPWMGAVSGIVGNLLMNNKLDLPEYNPETYVPTKVSPHLVNYGRSREQIMNERDLADNMILGSARGTGSQNQLMETLLAGKTATQRTAGQQFNTSLENESNTNAQILNQADQMNAQLSADAARMNMQNELYSNQVKRENMLMNAERKNAKIQGIMDSATGYLKDRMEANKYDNMLQMMTPDNYAATSGKDSKWRKIFGISPDMNMVLTGTDRFKEKGGYIGDIQLFGDDKYEKLMMRVNKDKKN